MVPTSDRRCLDVLGPLATRRTDSAGVPGRPFPHPDAERLPLWRRWVVAGGNEAYMIVHPDEVDMVREVYATTPHGLEVIPLINVGPYAVEGVDTHSHGTVIEGCTQLADDPMRCIDAESPDGLLTFDAVEAQGRFLDLKPAGWSLQVVQELVASGRYVVTYQNGFDVVLRKTAPPPPG
jgi:hypothetical protein